MAQEQRKLKLPTRKVKRPQAVILIASLTIISGLYSLALLIIPPLNQEQGDYDNKEVGWENTIQRTWGFGIAITEIIIGIFTFGGKEWAWNSNVVSQTCSLTYLSISISTMPNIEGEHAIEQFLVSIIIPIIILPCLFKSEVRSYFGKGNFSLKDLVRLDIHVAKKYLHHLWIAAICASVLFSVMGLLVLIASGLHNREIIWIALYCL